MSLLNIHFLFLVCHSGPESTESPPIVHFFFQKRDQDWIVDPIFRQRLRLTRVLKEGLRLDFRSHFKAGIENGLKIPIFWDCAMH